MFLFTSLLLAPVAFNASFHVAGSLFYRSYSPGRATAVVLFPALAWNLAGEAGFNGGIAGAAVAVGAVLPRRRPGRNDVLP